MFGLLNDPGFDTTEPDDYAFCRGRFYLFWNCMVTSGVPMLVALMAGQAAYEAEVTDNYVIVDQVMIRLSKIFSAKRIPSPKEVIITRWKKDPFARGTYSFVGPATQPDDYDTMAKACGPLHFAGEATCGTHPATVHGAYLSGLRAASEVMDRILGPQVIRTSPLVAPKSKLDTPRSVPRKKYGYVDIWEPINKPDPDAVQKEAEQYETSITDAITEALGPRPNRPTKTRMNPYILFASEKWEEAKNECKARKIALTGDQVVSIDRHEIRASLGKAWRNAPDDVKAPYIERCKDGRESALKAASDYEALVEAWDHKAAVIRAEYMENNKPPAHMLVDGSV